MSHSRTLHGSECATAPPASSPRAGARSKGHRTWGVYVRSLEPKNSALWPCCFGATFAEIRIIRAVTQLLTRLAPVRNLNSLR